MNKFKIKAAQAPPVNPDLPPWSEEAEQAALGCVLMGAESYSPNQKLPIEQQMAEVDALLLQLGPSLFYDNRHQEIFKGMVQLRMEGHALNVITLQGWLKNHKLLEGVGGLPYLNCLPEKTPNVFAFPTFLQILKDKALRRWTLQKRARLTELVLAEDLTIEAIQGEFSSIAERASQIGGGKAPLLDIITADEARAFVPDPSDLLLGQGLISRGTFITIGGEPGAGKSRLATTLAVAGARGTATWLGYPVRTKWKTLILQTENTGMRLKEEFEVIPKEYGDFIRISRGLSHGLAFDNPDFRRELRRFYDQWKFQMLVVDPWNDVSSEEGQRDFKQALLNISAVFRGDKMPAVVIVAHLRKRGRDEGQKRKTGRDLLHELSGSLALGSTSRTVFAVQPGSSSTTDDRVVIELAKNNDVDPEWLKEFGSRSAWHRKNGAFTPCKDFNWQEWENPGDEERRKVTDEMLTAAFDGEPELKPAGVAKKLKSLFGVGESTVYRAIGEDGYLRELLIRTGTGKLKLKD